MAAILYQPKCHNCWHPYIEGILPKGPYPPYLGMADRALLAGHPRYDEPQVQVNVNDVQKRDAELSTHPLPTERERDRSSLSAFLGTEDIGVDIVHISRVIITYTLE